MALSESKKWLHFMYTRTEIRKKGQRVPAPMVQPNFEILERSLHLMPEEVWFSSGHWTRGGEDPIKDDGMDGEKMAV